MEQEDFAQDVAIIGYGGRFGGCQDLQQFWQMLESGASSARLLTVQEQEALQVPASLRRHPQYVPLSNEVPGIEEFDAAYFGITETEAAVMDPQRRMLLEAVVHALEDAAQIPGQARTGTFLSCGQSEYFLLNLGSRPDLFDTLGGVLLGTLNGQDFCANQVAYKLNLHGPAVNLNTACSSSLVALHYALNSLHSGECDLALAGGASFVLAQRHGYVAQPGGINSVHGVCRPFDAQADGTLPGSGAAVVVLKRLQDALQDGDPIRAVLRGSAINNDGARKPGFTAPSVDGQIEVIQEALAVSAVSPRQISYLETHGTGTLLGDAIEIAALRKVFGGKRQPALHLGSLKANIGHTNAAAGVAALIKTVMSLEQQILPPLANLRQAGHDLSAPDSRLQVSATPVPWPRGEKARIAGVSSFGIGGTNAHVIVQEAPLPQPPAPSVRDWHVLPLCAKDQSALAAMQKNMAAFLQGQEKPDWEAISYTLACARQPQRWRRALVYGADAINKGNPNPAHTGDGHDGLDSQAGSEWRNVWLIGGQGQDVLPTLRVLHAQQSLFREACRQAMTAFENLDPDFYRPLWQQVLHGDSTPAQDTRSQQPLIFVCAYAQCRMWQALGLHADALLGHSLGEYVAACVGGMFTLEEAATLVDGRAQLMQACPAGGMLALHADPAQWESMRAGLHLHLALHNSPGHVVAAGDEAQLAILQQRCAAQDIVCKRLDVNHAFHTPLMAQALPGFARLLQNCRMQGVQIPVLRNLDGQWHAQNSGPGADYWLRHLAEPVQFAACLEQVAALGAQGGLRILEIGAGNGWSRILARHPQLAAHCIPGRNAPGADPAALFAARLAECWESGATIDWQAYFAQSARRTCHLPPYPFTRKHFWVTPGNALRAREQAAATDCFYYPQWQRYLPAEAACAPQSAAGAVHLLLDDGSPFAAKLCQDWEMWEAGQENVAGAKVLRLRHQAGLSAAQISKQQAVFDWADVEQWQQILPLISPLISPFILPLPGALNAEDQAELHLHYCLGAQQAGLEQVMCTLALRVASWLGPLQHHGLRSLSILGEDQPQHQPDLMALDAALRALGLEVPGLSTRLIALDLPAAHRPDGAAQLVPQLRHLLHTPHLHDSFRLGHQLQQLRYQALGMSSAEPGLAEDGWHAGGTYLLIGGLGRVGRMLSREIAADLPVTWIISGRRALPPGLQIPGLQVRRFGAQDHGSVLDQQACDHLQHLLERGCQVHYWECDLHLHAEQIGQALQEHGCLNGVVYAATSGNQSLALLPHLTAAKIRAELLAKVEGLRQLHALLADLRPAFTLVMSSMSAILGGIGHVAYAAANAWQDAFCRQWAGQGYLALNWDGWEDVPGSEHNLSARQAVQTLRRALAGPVRGQLLVSRQALAPRLATWVYRQRRPLLPQNTQSTPLPTAAAGTGFQEKLDALWRGLLGPNIALDEDAHFFRLGGDSLLAIQLLAQARKELGLDLSFQDFMRDPSIKAFKHRWQARQQPWSPLLCLQAGGRRDNGVFCVHAGGGGVQTYTGLAAQMEGRMPLFALQAASFGPDEVALPDSLQQMAAGYKEAICRQQGAGPYLLLGFCFGAMIAYEIVRQLEAEGKTVAALVVVDGHPPGVEDGFFDQRAFLLAHLDNLKLRPYSQEWFDALPALPAAQQAQAICRQIDWGTHEPGLQAKAARLVEGIIRSNHAKNSYLPQGKIKAPLHLFRIDDAQFHLASNAIPDLGWSDFATVTSIEYVQGPHLQVMTGPTLTLLAARLEQIAAAQTAQADIVLETE